MNRFLWAGLVLLCTTPAFAGNASAPVPVTATVAATCVLTVADSSMYTNATSMTSQWLSGVENTLVLCTKGAVFGIAINQGTNPDPASTCDNPQRRLKSPAGVYVGYQFKDSRKGTVIGCGTANSPGFTAVSGTAATFVPMDVTPMAGQDVPVGTYSDQVTMSVTF